MRSESQFFSLVEQMLNGKGIFFFTWSERKRSLSLWLLFHYKKPQGQLDMF